MGILFDAELKIILCQINTVTKLHHPKAYGNFVNIMIAYAVKKMKYTVRFISFGGGGGVLKHQNVDEGVCEQFVNICQLFHYFKISQMILSSFFSPKYSFYVFGEYLNTCKK